MIPKYVRVKTHCKIPTNKIITESELDILKREGFKEDEILNYIEGSLRDRIWEFIPDNVINIEFD